MLLYKSVDYAALGGIAGEAIGGGEGNFARRGGGWYVGKGGEGGPVGVVEDHVEEL